MKKLFTLILLLAAINTGFAQVIFSEDFDIIGGSTAGGAGTYTFPSGWLLRDVDNRTPASSVAYVNAAWERREDFGQSVVDSVAFSTSWYTPEGPADDWMWTPPITVTQQCELSWNAKAYDSEFPDGYEVRIMVAPDEPTGGTGVLGNQVSNSTVLFSTANESSTWVHRTADLDAYEGQTVRIAFRNNSNNQFLLVIDDVVVESLLDYDASISAHSRPSEYSQIPLAQNFEFIASATISSSGAQNLTSLTLKADIYNSDNNLVFTTSETVNGTYAQGSNTVITASTPFVPTDTGTYSIEYSVQTVPPDQASANDSAFDSFFISDSVFARDKGTIAGGLGIGAGVTGYMGQHYVLNQPAVLTSVSMYMTNLPQEGDLQMAVFDFDNGSPTTLLYQTPQSFIGPLSGWVTFDIPGGIALDADTFVVTAVEIDSTISLGLTNDIYTVGSTWVDWATNPSAGWANNEDFGPQFAKAYMIRANFFENFTPDFIAVTPDTSIGVCENPIISVLDGLLQVTDEDDDQTLTWDIATPPQFGTVSGFPFSTAATGGTVIPSGLGYTPDPAYEGYDTIKVSVSDGTDTDTIRIIINAGDPEPGTTWYLDADDDGYYGDAVASCESPGPGYTQVELADEDCNDNDPEIHPGAVDVCDGVNNNCDGETDEDFVPGSSCITCQSGTVVDDSPTWYLDSDEDGYYTGSPVTQCESPGLGYTDETPLGGDDCNDENPESWISVTYYIDSDEDGYDNGSETFCSGDAIPGGYSSTTGGSDCNDDDFRIHEAPVVTISPSEDQMVCSGGTVDLTASINTYYFEGEMSGESSVPSNASPGSAVFDAVFDVSTGQLTLNIEYGDLTGTTTAAHIHVGAPGVNGPVIIPFTNFTTGSTSGNFSDVLTVPPANVADLISGNTYINIHTTTFPGGEIRGQLIPTLDWEWSTSATTATITAGPGDYTVSASVYGCTGTADITVIEDTVKPIAICQNITVQLDGEGYAEISVDDLNNGSTDNCGIASLSVGFTGFGCAELGENPMTLTVTDNSGNSSTCTAIVTVADTIDPEFLTGTTVPVPELLYYKFDGTGTSVSNLASTPPSGTETAEILGGLTQGSEGLCESTALVGTGLGSSTDYVNTGWVTNLPGSWTISFWSQGNFNTGNTQYAFGDFNAGEFRCFTNGVAGSGNWILRGALTDVVATGGATSEGAITTFVYDQPNSNIKAYVNGTLVSTVGQAGVTINGTGPFKVGGYNTNRSIPDGALMDEFRIYNRALSEEEIAELANICETVAGCPENVTTTADAGVCSAAVNYTTPEAVDNCDDVTITQVAGLPSGSDFPVGTTTNTFTATDASGNVATCSFDVIVTDNEAPTALCHNVIAYLDENGEATITGADVNNSSADNCGIASLSVSPDNFDCDDVQFESNQVTLTVTDVNGNTNTCTANVTVRDTIDPVAICQNITIQLDNEGVAEISAEEINNGSSDACGIESISVEPSVFDCEDVGTNTVTLTVTDVNGNTSTCEATVTVEDVTNPSASCQSVTISLDENGNATVTAAQVDDGSSDACGVESLSVSPNTFTCNEVGDNTVTLTVTDVNGNTSTCEATVTVEDNTNPTATCQAVTVWLDENGEASVTGEQVDNGSTDACGIESLSVNPNSFGCDDIGENPVLLTVTDVNGNTAVCEAIVTVVDTISPVIICPEDITVNTDEGLCSAVVTYDLPQATDNCGSSGGGTETQTFNYTGSLQTFTVPAGVTSVRISATGANGGDVTENEPAAGGLGATLSGDFAVSPGDVLNIIVGGKGNSDPSSSGGGGGSGVNLDGSVLIVAGGGAGVDFQDPNYEGKNATLANNGFPGSGGGGAGGSAGNDGGDWDFEGNISRGGRGWNSGSSGSFGQDGVTSNTTYTAGTWGLGGGGGSVGYGWCNCGGGGGGYSGGGSGYINQSGGGGGSYNTGTNQDNQLATGTGNGVVTITYTAVPVLEPVLISGLASGSVFPLGTTTIEYVVADASGNTDTCSFDITIEDNEDPTAVCQNVTVSLDENGNASVTAAQVNDGSGDACGIESISVSPNTFTCNDAGDNTVTLTVTDVNGNSSTCEATVTVEDNTNPVAVCQAITIQLDGEGVAEISAGDIDNGSSDICGIESLSLSQSEFNCSNVGANTVILTVTDVNGNTSSCEATVTVEDNVAPVAVCQSITVSLNESGSVTISGEQVNDGSSDACGIGSMTVSPNTFTCEDVGDNTVTLTVTDVNGNTATCTSTVTVEDNTNPVALCHNITVQLDENGEATITGADIDNGSSDECGIESLSVSPNSFDCDNVDFESNQVTLTVTDVNGNISTCTANVTVQDNVDPVAVCQNVTIQLDENGNGSVSAEQVDGGSTDACGITSLSVSPNEFNCNNVGANTVTLTVTDVNGNTSTCEATVTVEDNVAPDAVCHNVTIALNENGEAFVEGENLGDGSGDACGIESFSVSTATFGCDDVGENTVTITVTDVNGNSSTCEATVTVEDNTNPVAVCQNVTIQLDANGNAILDAADVDNGSSDVCGIASMSVSPNEFNCNDIGANSVLFTVTDVNGNSSSCEASVTVEDSVDPVAVCQAVTIQLDENGEASVSAEQVNNGSSDACGIASMELDQTGFDCSDMGANTVTLTVTDNNGNSSTCTATVTVEDNVDPVAVCQSITIQLDENGNVTLDAADIDDGSTDNCGIASMSVDVSNFDCLNVGENVVTFTVTDNSGNSDACMATVTIEDNVAPVVSCQNITVELDANGEATITAADLDNGSADACGIASLSASQTSFDCSDIGTNTVILTVIDNNGNSSSCEATVTVEDNIDPVLTVSEDITACSGDENGAEVTYDAPSYTDNCTATIIQTAGFESGALFPVGVTTNTFEVTDAGGNTVTASFTVTVNPPPVADFTAVNGCSDSPISFVNTSTVSTGTIEGFDWDFGDGAGSTDENPSHQYTIDSTYTVTLTITTDGGCNTSVSHDVTAYPVPTFILETTNVSCNGAGDGKIVVVVNNGPGPFYHSLNGGAEQELNTFTGLQPGSYTVSSRNQYNCTYSQTVTVAQPAPLSVSLADSSSTDCTGEAGGSLRFAASGGTAPYQYYLDGSNVNHSSGIFNNITGGPHTVSVTDANGCTLSAVASVPVSLGLPVAGFTIDLNGFEVEFNNISVGATNYHWEFGDGPGSSGADPTHIYTTPGIYTVMLIASNECGSDTAYFTVDMTTGINTPGEDGYSINVFPNPNNGSFTMMLESAGFMDELVVRLWTVEGKLIDDMIVAPGGNTYTRSFSYQLAAGMYVLEVSEGSKTHHQRIIVK